MVRIRRLIIIRCMTSSTGIRCIRVIAVVAGGTIIGNSNMGPVQSIVIIMYRESRRFPIRSRGMAHFTVGRNTERYVIRVDGLIIIGGMATGTGIRCIGIVAVVTSVTIIGYLYMGTREGINGIMIKSGRYPASLRVTGGTIRRKLRSSVIRIGGLVIISRMTSRTLSWCPSISSRVAVKTISREVGSLKREVGRIVIESIISITGGVAGKTGRTVVSITSNTIVLIIGFRIGMTGCTSDYSIIGRIGMTIHTGIPFALVRTAINREILCVVVKIGWFPGGLTVAGSAIS